MLPRTSSAKTVAVGRLTEAASCLKPKHQDLNPKHNPKTPTNSVSRVWGGGSLEDAEIGACPLIQGFGCAMHRWFRVYGLGS